MSIDIAEFIDAQVEKSVRADRARQQRAETRVHPWQRWLGLSEERAEEDAPLP